MGWSWSGLDGVCAGEGEGEEEGRGGEVHCWELGLDLDLI